MDPYVVAAAKPGQILHLDCRELNHDLLRLPEGYELVAEETGIQRRLADTPYNARRAELQAALEQARRQDPDLRGLCDLAPEAFERIAPHVAATPRRRARHVVTEAARVAAAVEAIQAGDMAALGARMNEGHTSLVEDFESSLPEIDRLAELARQKPHVLGARLNGAGWGGRLAILQTAMKNAGSLPV